MFSFFRRGLTAKLMLVFLGLALFAMVVTGFGTDSSGLGALGGGGSVASVDGEDIAEAEVSDQVQRQLSRMRQEQPELDIAALLQGGGLEEIVEQLITSTALAEFGRDHGIAASKQMIDREIASIPAFQNLAGQFDNEAFKRALAAENVSEQQLRKELANTLIQRQLMLPVAASGQVPQGVALQYASLLLESRTGILGIVPTRLMGAGNEPTDAEVAAFYRQNRARYTIPERRVLRYAVFGAEQVAAAATPTPAEIAAAYRANASRYAARETRTLSQVVLPDEAAARAFAAKLAQGTSFAQAAQQAGFAPADTALGQQTREAFSRSASPAVAAAAFGAAKGSTTAPVRSELGWHVVRVDDVTATPARPLAAVQGEIAAQLRQQKMQEALGSMVARVEEKIADGSSFDEIVASEKLVQRDTAPITGNGSAPGVQGWQPPAELKPLLKTGFDMAPDEDPVVETVTPGQSFALLGVRRMIPAAPPPLPQIQARVKADLVARRALDRAKAVATSIMAKINAGTPPAQAFAESQVKLPPVQTITARRMDIARRNQTVPPPLQLMFSLPRGKARLLPGPNGSGWFVVYLDKVVPGNASGQPQLVTATRGQFAEVLGNEYAQQFTRAIRRGMEIEKDEKAIAALKRRLRGGTQ